MDKYTWSVASALYQIRNGQTDSKRTASAKQFLLNKVYGENSDAADTRVIATTLIQYVAETR